MTRARTTSPIGLGLAVALASVTAVLAFTGPAAATTRHKPQKAAGPSLKILGFGINRLFVPDGKTISRLTSSTDCAQSVGAQGDIGPPQNIYFEAYVQASAIPGDSPLRFMDAIPFGDGMFDTPTLTSPVRFSRALAKGALPFGGPPRTKDVYRLNFVSTNDPSGPSASDFDGTYSLTVKVKVGPHMLSSTAKVTFAC
jgi:hypothetical protein